MKALSIILLGISIGSVVTWFVVSRHWENRMLSSIYYDSLTESERYGEIVILIKNNQTNNAISKANDWRFNHLAVINGCNENLCKDEEHPKLQNAITRYQKEIRQSK